MFGEFNMEYIIISILFLLFNIETKCAHPTDLRLKQTTIEEFFENLGGSTHKRMKSRVGEFNILGHYFTPRCKTYDSYIAESKTSQKKYLLTKYNLQYINIPTEVIANRIVFLFENYKMFRCEGVFFNNNVPSVDYITPDAIGTKLRYFYVVEPFPMICLADYALNNTVDNDFLKEHLPNVLNTLSSLHSVKFPYLQLSPFTIIYDEKLWLRPPSIAPYASPKSLLPPPPHDKSSPFRSVDEMRWYRAPEWNAVPPFFQSDSWSLACIVAEYCLFGKPLFGATTDTNQQLATQSILGPAPAQLNWIQATEFNHVELPRVLVKLLDYDPRLRAAICLHVSIEIMILITGDEEEEGGEYQSYNTYSYSYSYSYPNSGTNSGQKPSSQHEKQPQRKQPDDNRPGKQPKDGQQPKKKKPSKSDSEPKSPQRRIEKQKQPKKPMIDDENDDDKINRFVPKIYNDEKSVPIIEKQSTIADFAPMQPFDIEKPSMQVVSDNDWSIQSPIKSDPAKKLEIMSSTDIPPIQFPFQGPPQQQQNQPENQPQKAPKRKQPQKKQPQQQQKEAPDSSNQPKKQQKKPSKSKPDDQGKTEESVPSSYYSSSYYSEEEDNGQREPQPNATTTGLKLPQDTQYTSSLPYSYVYNSQSGKTSSTPPVQVASSVQSESYKYSYDYPYSNSGKPVDIKETSSSGKPANKPEAPQTSSSPILQTKTSSSYSNPNPNAKPSAEESSSYSTADDLVKPDLRTDDDIASSPSYSSSTASSEPRRVPDRPPPGQEIPILRRPKLGTVDQSSYYYSPYYSEPASAPTSPSRSSKSRKDKGASKSSKASRVSKTPQRPRRESNRIENQKRVYTVNDLKQVRTEPAMSSPLYSSYSEEIMELERRVKRIEQSFGRSQARTAAPISIPEPYSPSYDSDSFIEMQMNIKELQSKLKEMDNDLLNSCYGCQTGENVRDGLASIQAGLGMFNTTSGSYTYSSPYSPYSGY